MNIKTNLSKVTKLQLSHILAVSYPTALKEYKIILASLNILNRNYLTQNDLIIYGLI